MIARVSRFVEIDAGHRVTRHESKCSNLHGHRYKITVEVEGPIKDDESPEHGMVMDFSRIKEALMVIHDRWDHRFLLGSDDPLVHLMSDLPGIIVLPLQPTAENLAVIAHSELREMLSPLKVTRVDVQETTRCTAHLLA